MSFRKHRKSLLVLSILAAMNGGCIDLVTESVKDGARDAITGAVANVISSVFEGCVEAPRSGDYVGGVVG